MLQNHKHEGHGEFLIKLADIVDTGALKPILDKQDFTLKDLARAYDRLETSKAIGKIVITI